MHSFFWRNPTDKKNFLKAGIVPTLRLLDMEELFVDAIANSLTLSCIFWKSQANLLGYEITTANN
jgi:hypothetical protein